MKPVARDACFYRLIRITWKKHAGNVDVFRKMETKEHFYEKDRNIVEMSSTFIKERGFEEFNTHKTYRKNETQRK